MSESKTSSGGGSVGCSGFGCVSLLLFIFLMWAWLFGLQINQWRLDIDLFPPAITWGEAL